MFTRTIHAITRRAFPLLIACCLLASMSFPSLGGSKDPTPLPWDGVADETSPIKITNDTELANAVSKYGWAGNGSEDNPYIIENMTINGSGNHYCLWLALSSDYILVRNNVLFGTTTTGPDSWTNAGLVLVSARKMTVLNNTIEGNYRYGVSLYSSTVSFLNNTVRNNNIGINVGGGFSTIEGNTLVNNGMRIEGYPTVENNTFIGDGTGTGVSVAKWTPRSVSSNRFSNLGIGILISSGTTTKFDNNTFDNCTSAYNIGLDDAKVTNSTIVDCPNGIGLDANRVVLLDNTLVRSAITLYDNANQEAMLRSHIIPTSNKVNGKPVNYQHDSRDIVIDPSTYGEYILVNCSNVTFANRTADISFSFYFMYGDNLTIENNEACLGTTSDWWVQHSEDVVISNNTIEDVVMDLYYADRLEFAGNSLDEVPTIVWGTAEYTFHNNTWIHHGAGPAVKMYAFEKDGTFRDNNITMVDPPVGSYVTATYTLRVEVLDATLTLRNNHLVGAGLFAPVYSLLHREFLDIDTSNTVNGRPILFLKDVSDRTVTGDYGQVIVKNSTRVHVEGLDMGMGDGGVSMYVVDDLTIDRCTFMDLRYEAVILRDCTNTSVRDCLFEGGNSRVYLHDCNEDLVKPYGDVTGNYFLNITLVDYWDGALELYDSPLSSISGNYFSNITGLGIFGTGEVLEISGNEFRNCTNWAYHGAIRSVKAYKNSFLDNRVYLDTQVGQTNTDNQWDDGSVGNFYSNYETRYPSASNDGTVWDTPYAFWHNYSKDRFPLVNYSDRIAPLVRLDHDDTTYPDTPTAFSAWAMDNLAVTGYAWSFDGGSTWTNLTGADVTHTFDSPGVRRVLVRVRDAANNTADATGTIRVVDNIAPVADAGDDQTVDPGVPVPLNASGSRDETGIVSWNWTFEYQGDETVLVGEVTNFTFQVQGVFNITLTVADEAGNTGTDAVTITVVDDETPVAVIGQDHVVPERTVLDLSGLDSTDNWRIETWNWTIRSPTGGLAWYDTSEISHRFDEVGTYTVTLRVTDPAGLWNETSINVTVLDVTYPVAMAGLDTTIDQGDSLHLDGTSSTDNVGIVNWTWTIVGPGLSTTLYGPVQDHTFPDPGTFTVTLTVSDAAVNSGSASFVLTVRDTESPTAEAGDDVTVDEGGAVTFDGRDSNDNVAIVWYTWTFEQLGEGVVLSSVEPFIDFTFPYPGMYNVTLTVLDAEGNVGTDQMTVTVLDITPPTAMAGDDVTVDQHAVVHLDSTGTNDNVEVVDLEWTFELEGETVTLGGWSPVFTFHVAGKYVVTLRVWDAAGHVATDTVNVTVLDTTPPEAVAGDDVTVDQGDTVELDGSATWDNVGIAEHTWTFQYDSRAVERTGPFVAFTFDLVGEYVVTLTVHDLEGNSGTDTLVVTVLDTEPPVAMAGDDVTVDQHALVAFDGSLSTDNVGVVDFRWALVHEGEPRELIGVTTEFTFDQVGVYIVSLTVSDGRGNNAIDTLTVTVRDAEPPVADAGLDVIVEEGDTVDFSGSACTDNVGVVSWKWTFVYNGTQEELEGEAASFAFRAAGTYTVTLEVADARGNTAQDTMVVTVEEPPVDGKPGPEDEGGMSMAVVGIALAVVVAAVIVAVVLWQRRRG